MTSFFCRFDTHNYTRARFTVLVPWSDQLAVHSYPFLYLQKQVAKLASALFYCWSLSRNTYIEKNLEKFT